MTSGILVLNAGSSSLKFQVFDRDRQLAVRVRGQIERIGAAPRFSAKDAAGRALVARDLDSSAGRDHAAALRFLAGWLRDNEGGSVSLTAVGHRVSHGGTKYSAPVRVDAEVLAQLEELVPLVPLHQPFNLAPIRALLETRPELAQVACFDTAFHATQPQLARLFGLPKHFYDEGVLRYGFHGLSYEYIAQQLSQLAPELARRRLVVAHLGSGASMCALSNLESVASTFGFSALEGLPMGTRSGSLDPGVVIFLARERGMPLEQIESMLYKQSGLLGLSGVSNDVRELLASREPDAALALEYFAYRAAREIGSLAAALGGLDAIVFTGGIGENSGEMRARICERSAWLGVQLDARANAAGSGRISTSESRTAVWVIPTNEELMIARHTLRLLQ